jgi:large subunit ribosomal protein L18
MKLENRKDYRARRHMRLRQKVKGTAARPRLAVFISNSHMYVQFVDDDAGSTLASASTLGAGATVNMTAAKALGEKAAEAAKAKGISLVVVDRGGFKFHGRVKQIVDAALAAGLKVREEEEAR